MSRVIRNIIILFGLVLSGLFFISHIRSMETLRADGATVLLKLRPVDPRALMQGDYMALAYNRQAFPPHDQRPDAPSGTLILQLDANRVGTFKRMEDGSEIGEGEFRLKYVRLFRGNVSIGGKRYYFQEGTAQLYEPAEYGVFKIDTSGRAMLVGLADESFELLTPD